MKGRRYKANEGYTAETLWQYGRDHVACAKVLFDKSFDCFDSAGYLSHLGIELILKAVLLEVCGSFPNDHDLVRLFTEIRQHDSSFDLSPTHMRTIAKLNVFFRLRYPNPREPVEIGDTFWRKVESLFRAVNSATPATLKKKAAQRDHTKKGGRILMRRKKTDWEDIHTP